MSSLLRRLETTRFPGTGSAGLRSRWFSTWTPELDDFCRELPGHPVYSTDLFKRLMQASQHRTAAIAIYENSRPTGLVALRAESGSAWAPLTAGWLDGCDPCWAAPKDVLRCHLAAGAYIRHIFARGTLEANGPIRRANPMDEYKVDVQQAEEFWHSSGHWKKVQKARNRAARDGTVVKLDAPDAAAWIVGNWSEKWGRDSDLQPYVREGVAYFLARGMAHCFTLENGGERSAGDLFLVNGDSFESICNYRQDGIEDTIVLDTAVQWAQQTGIRWFNLGPAQSDSYKRKWAPAHSPLTEIDVAPWHVFGLLNAKHAVSRILSRRGQVEDSVVTFRAKAST